MDHDGSIYLINVSCQDAATSCGEFTMPLANLPVAHS